MPYMCFTLKDGTEVKMETAVEPTELRPGRTMRGGDPAATEVMLETDAEPTAPRPGTTMRGARSFEAALGAVKKMVATAINELQDSFPDRPDELEIEFGITASVEANGLILAKAAGEASFTVKALWKKPGAPADGASS
jgi:hypothetical protein